MSLFVDFMAFYFTKMHILPNVDKEASAYGELTPTRALPPDPVGDFRPKAPAMSSNHGDRSTPMLKALTRGRTDHFSNILADRENGSRTDFSAG